MNINYELPRNIICLTEESVETLYAIGLQDYVKGVSIFVKRPEEALVKPKVSAFTHSNIKKILELKPDLVLGFSDIQKDIARDLIEAGLNVFISNQRSTQEIFSYIQTLCSMLGAGDRATPLIERMQHQISVAISNGAGLRRRPRVYFEEWDEPMISAIRWVSECIEFCGGDEIFQEKSTGLLAKERFVTSLEVIDENPDIILACHCGKKVSLESFYEREDWSGINAIKNRQVFELMPEVFLQPGPAPYLDGLEILTHIFKNWNETTQD